MLKPLQLHAYDLAKALISIDGVTSLRSHDWLLFASGIDSVNFDTTKYDDCIEYCNVAAAYENSRIEFVQGFVKNLTVFQFIWGAFEALLVELDLSEGSHASHERTGVDSFCHFIRSNEVEAFEKLRYEALFDKFTALAESYFNFSKLHLQSHFATPEHVSLYGHGLYVVSKIRGYFAHGITRFPEIYEQENGLSLDAELMTLSSRIVLLSMQMLILAYYAGTSSFVDCWWTEQFGEEKDKVPLEVVFSELQRDGTHDQPIEKE